MSQHDDPMIGRTLRGSIEIIRRIGEGGMGYVYEAYQPHLERRLAVKVMTPEHARNPVASEYFIREAKSASRLRHPNIIQIIDFGKEDDQTLFLAMEFLPGRPLTELLAEEFPLSAKRIIEIMRQTLSGLDEAHAHHIVHRDLKPDNLMVERTRGGKDFVKILDFGIAHLRDREAKAGPLTQQGAVLGTPHYMSPEQSRGDRVDARSDLFAMGIILYELLTGEVPFRGDSMPQVLVNIMSTEPLAPSSCRADLSIDPHLEAICLRALKKDVELRYQSARDFMAAFEDIKVSVRATPQVTDKFIFKRSKKLSGTRHKRPPPAAAPVRDTLESPPPPIQSLHEESTGHVVDVVDLFGSQEHEPSSPSEAVVLASEPAAAGVSAPQTPAQPLSSYAALGLDVEALRGDLLGERRHVTALTFHQRSHAQVDPEELLELHEHVHHHLTLALEQWQGVLQSRQGGFGVMLFGFEQPRSDDAFRAVQCALVLRKLVRRIAPGSIGFAFVITQGEVFAPQGDLSRVAGGALDLGSDAARQAGDDMVLAVGSELQDQLSVTFGLGPALKDGARPILGALDVEQVTASHAAEMVGRDRELASILGVLGRVGRGSGELLGITGEGGQGKSRLIHEAVKLAEPRNMLVLRARWRGEGAVALRASICAWLSDLLRQLARPREELLVALHELGVPAEYARLLDALMREKLHELVGTRGDVGVLESAANTGRAIEAAFRRAAQELSKERSLMLVLDEVGQSQDEVFSATLNRWSETLTTHNILLLTGVRTQPGVAHPDFPTGATVFHLDPLHESACYAYLRLMLPAHTPEMLCAKLVRLSAGSPLQLEQLALFLRDHASASMEEVEARLAEVRGIKQLMRMRVFGLPRAAQNLLGLLAVLGDGADMQEIFDLAAPHWEPEATLQGLYEEGVLEVEETDLSARLYFMPPALGQVIYRTMSKKARERTHARALHYIQEQLHAQQGQATRAQQEGMVRHLEALGRHEDASRVLTLLSGEAQRSFEHESAAALLTRQLKILAKMGGEPEKLARVKLQLAQAYDGQGMFKEALDVVLKLDREESLSPLLKHEIRLELAALWIEEEDTVLLERVLKPLIVETRDVPEETWIFVRAQQLLASAYEKQGKLQAAMRLLLDALDVMERRHLTATQNPCGPSLLWEPLNQLGRLRLKAQDLKGAQKMFQLALDAAQQAEDVRGEVHIRANMATMLVFQNRLDDAYRCLQAAIRLTRRTGQMRTLAKLHHNRGLLHMRQHRQEVALEALEESLSLSRELDWREGIAMNVNQLRLMREREPAGSNRGRS